jgi:hypothetical protein
LLAAAAAADEEVHPVVVAMSPLLAVPLLLPDEG